MLCGMALAGPAQAQGQGDAAAMRAEISRLLGQGKHAQAVTIAQRYVKLVRQKYGEQHSEFVMDITWLAGGYRIKVLDAQHPDVGTSLNNLALLLMHQGRDPEAEPPLRRSARRRWTRARHRARCSTTWPASTRSRGRPSPPALTRSLPG